MAIINFFPVGGTSLMHMRGDLTFDVYLRLAAQKYTKIFNKAKPVDLPRLQGYIMKGTQRFYISTNDRKSFLLESNNVLRVLFQDPVAESAGVVSVLDELAEQVLDEIIYQRVFGAHTHAVVSSVVMTYTQIAAENPQLLPLLLKLARTKSATVRHMITTSIFSMLLARAYDPTNKLLHFYVGYAGFVHDIGLALLNTNADEHSFLVGQQLTEIHKHPKVSVDILRQTEIPEPVLTAIAQHHENYDGSGYPSGLRGDDISIGARILAVCDVFAGLTAGSNNSAPLSPPMAVHALTRSSNLDTRLVSMLAKLLKF